MIRLKKGCPDQEKNGSRWLCHGNDQGAHQVSNEMAAATCLVAAEPDPISSIFVLVSLVGDNLLSSD